LLHPREKFPHVLFDQFLATLNLASARIHSALGHGLQRIHVVEEDSFEAVQGRIEIARHGKIDEEKRTVTAGGYDGREFP
jgi:CRISPR/Cas system CMR subunit Cmr4 (Cas7 group RAMP superfamily)